MKQRRRQFQRAGRCELFEMFNLYDTDDFKFLSLIRFILKVKKINNRELEIRDKRNKSYFYARC